MWRGDYKYLINQLVMREFNVRYRNMSLGMLWSILNPLVMMTVLAFVFTNIFPNRSISHFAMFILCGLLPYNFFCLGWGSATVSLVDNAALVKRVPIPRVLIPICSVLSNCLHLLVQIALLLGLCLLFGLRPTVYWLWLPLLWAIEIVFICGFGMACAALDVFARDMRYIVESFNTVMFWLVPIFYPVSLVPAQFRTFYEYNPIAAVAIAQRNVLLDGMNPPAELLVRLAIVSAVALMAGYLVFHDLERRFYDYV
jgi:ABC-type polysaccharide/polyol phosphate export permease